MRKNESAFECEEGESVCVASRKKMSKVFTSAFIKRRMNSTDLNYLFLQEVQKYSRFNLRGRPCMKSQI